MRADRVTPLGGRGGSLHLVCTVRPLKRRNPRSVCRSLATVRVCVCVCVYEHISHILLPANKSVSPRHGEKRPSLLTLRKINVSGWGRLFSGTAAAGCRRARGSFDHAGSMRGRHGARFSVCVIYCSDGTEGTGGGSQSEKSPTHYGKTSRAGRLESAEGIFFENVTEEEQTVKKLTPPLPPSTPPSVELDMK